MDLWIRSQDRECLLKTDIVVLEEKEEKKEYWIYAGHERYEPDYVFGVYHTKERALEVLNEIENTIYINKLFIADISAFQKVLENEGYTEEEISKALRTISVYQMPER